MATRAEIELAAVNLNVLAFLRAIRLGEGTADPDGYRRIVGGELFDSFADHPRKRVWIAAYKVWSSAAGAYQFIASTWDEMRAKYALPDFSPASQDLAAVALIDRRGALADVISGRIEQAIVKCRLEWASLPGSPYGQRTEKLEAVLAEYRKYGGLLEGQQPAPIVESQPTWEAPMSPFVVAALPALIKEIPGLIRSFGSGEVTERNAAAAEAVLNVVQQATGTSNAQAAIEAVASDPAKRAAATEALAAEHWFDVTEAGSTGIEGAREFARTTTSQGERFWEMGVFWVTVLLLPLLYLTTYWVLTGSTDAFSGELRAAVASAVVTGVLSGITGFWLGLKFSAPRQAVTSLGR